MDTHASPYDPINCDLHDLLEDLATVRKVARIRFHDSDGLPQQRQATIRDVFTKEGAEYVVLGSGETLRLDQLVEVDGTKMSEG